MRSKQFFATKSTLFLISVFFIIVFSSVFFISNFSLLTSAFAAKSTDAIAIRVIPNPENYSARRWYEKQGFIGSPQAITVDGYDAIRDGRTVYVNVSNISGNDLFTNIYLISYNQAAEGATIDIFSQILFHWKFNTNISAVGQCSSSVEIACGLDSECPASEYCLSAKAVLIRDTKRLAGLADINEALKDYKIINNRYPRLAIGSYLPNKTISVWPSWQNILARDLGMSLPIDPINKLGECGSYNPVTCWDSAKKEFVNADFEMPAGSNVYVYEASADGFLFDLCAVMESGRITTLDQGACAGSALAAATVEKTGAISKDAPVITGVNLPEVYSGEEFIGYVSVSNVSEDILTWELNVGATSWDGWSERPVLQDTGAPNQKRIYAKKAGDVGEYSFSVIVTSSAGTDRKENLIIKVTYPRCKIWRILPCWIFN